MFDIARTALSARPDAPDVRVVTVAQLERWVENMEEDWCVGGYYACMEIRAIIEEPKE